MDAACTFCSNRSQITDRDYSVWWLINSYWSIKCWRSIDGHSTPAYTLPLVYGYCSQWPVMTTTKLSIARMNWRVMAHNSLTAMHDWCCAWLTGHGIEFRFSFGAIMYLRWTRCAHAFAQWGATDWLIDWLIESRANQSAPVIDRSITVVLA